jgi:hypothetical protein
VFVGLFRDIDAVLRTYYNTQTTAFAAFGINYYFASHSSITHLSQNQDGKILPSAIAFVK